MRLHLAELTRPHVNQHSSGRRPGCVDMPSPIEIDPTFRNVEGFLIEREPARDEQGLRILQGRTRVGDNLAVNVTYREPLATGSAENDIGTAAVTPLGIHHGWGGTQEAYKGLSVELARQGQANYTYDDDRTLGLLADLNPLNWGKVAQLSSMAGWGAMKLVGGTLGVQKFHLYGHSKGSQTVTDLALRHPHLVESLTIDGSPAIFDHDLLDMIENSAKFIPRELLPNARRLASLRLVQQTLYHALRNSGRTLAEGLNIGAADLRERLAALPPEIGCIAIGGAGDTFSPADAAEAGHGGVVKIFHRHDDPEANHLWAILEPEITARAILSNIARLRVMAEQARTPVADIAA